MAPPGQVPETGGVFEPLGCPGRSPEKDRAWKGLHRANVMRASKSVHSFLMESAERSWELPRQQDQKRRPVGKRVGACFPHFENRNVNLSQT